MRRVLLRLACVQQSKPCAKVFRDFFGKSDNAGRRSVDDYFFRTCFRPSHHSYSSSPFRDVSRSRMPNYCERLPSERVHRLNWIGWLQSGIAYDARYPRIQANWRA